jgi:hypothetical protein
MNLPFSEILSKSFTDFANQKIIKILLICFILTFFFTIFFIYQFYINIIDPFFENLYNLLSANANEIFFLNYLLKFKIFNFILILFKYLFILLKLFIVWFIISIIVTPVNNLITSFFFEKIFFEINKIYDYKWKFIIKKNSFFLALQSSFFFIFISIAVNICLLPMYFILPFANILIFILVNAYFSGKEMCNGIIVQFFSKKDDKLKNFYEINKNLIYTTGCVTSAIQLIPILNFFSAGFSIIMVSHLILNHFRSNEIIKKKKFK